MYFRSEGVLRYSESDDRFWLVVDVDPGIVEVARALVPKSIRLNRQRYEPHITVVRNEKPPDLAAWRRWADHPVGFEYDPLVCDNAVYFWLQAFCPRLNAIRRELGLPTWSDTSRPPDLADCFHITIGNLKP